MGVPIEFRSPIFVDHWVSRLRFAVDIFSKERNIQGAAMSHGGVGGIKTFATLDMLMICR